jgi:hypothetical protein
MKSSKAKTMEDSGSSRKNVPCEIVHDFREVSLKIGPSIHRGSLLLEGGRRYESLGKKRGDPFGLAMNDELSDH